MLALLCYVSLNISLFVPASGRLKMEKDIAIIDIDDEHDDQCTSRGVPEKKATSGSSVENEHPPSSSLIAVQQKSKFANAIDTVKSKYFCCSYNL